MLECPHGDWTSTSTDPVNEQVANLLRHYEATHGGVMPKEVRDLLKACANALGGIKA